MKKILISLLITVLAFSLILTGCGNNSKKIEKEAKEYAKSLGNVYNKNI